MHASIADPRLRPLQWITGCLPDDQSPSSSLGQKRTLPLALDDSSMAWTTLAKNEPEEPSSGRFYGQFGRFAAQPCCSPLSCWVHAVPKRAIAMRT